MDTILFGLPILAHTLLGLLILLSLFAVSQPEDGTFADAATFHAEYVFLEDPFGA